MSDDLGFEPVMGLFLDEGGKGRVAISKEGWSFLPQEARLQLLEEWIAELGDIRAVAMADAILDMAGIAAREQIIAKAGEHIGHLLASKETKH